MDVFKIFRNPELAGMRVQIRSLREENERLRDEMRGIRDELGRRIEFLRSESIVMNGRMGRAEEAIWGDEDEGEQS